MAHKILRKDDYLPKSSPVGPFIFLMLLSAILMLVDIERMVFWGVLAGVSPFFGLWFHARCTKKAYARWAQDISNLISSKQAINYNDLFYWTDLTVWHKIDFNVASDKFLKEVFARTEKNWELDGLYTAFLKRYSIEELTKIIASNQKLRYEDQQTMLKYVERIKDGVPTSFWDLTLEEINGVDYYEAELERALREDDIPALEKALQKIDEFSFNDYPYEEASTQALLTIVEKALTQEGAFNGAYHLIGRDSTLSDLAHAVAKNPNLTLQEKAGFLMPRIEDEGYDLNLIDENQPEYAFIEMARKQARREVKAKEALKQKESELIAVMDNVRAKREDRIRATKAFATIHSKWAISVCSGTQAAWHCPECAIKGTYSMKRDMRDVYEKQLEAGAMLRGEEICGTCNISFTTAQIYRGELDAVFIDISCKNCHYDWTGPVESFIDSNCKQCNAPFISSHL